MRKLVVLLVVALMSVMCMGCSRAAKVDEQILIVLDAEKITQKMLDDVFSAYDKLSSEEKFKVENYDRLEKYRGVDIESVNDINDEIDAINESVSFEELLKLREEVDGLDTKAKALINQNQLDYALAPNELEKAAIAACQAIKKCLKSSSSFELNEATIIDDLEGSRYYLVEIDYSATNGFGGRKDDISFQTISEDFENPWLPLGLLLGNVEEALNCSSFLQHYLLHDEEPISLDCEKIMYYIDMDVKK